MEEGKKTWSIVLYKAPDGTSAIDVKFEWETVWLNQIQLSELFDVDRTVITRHINNIIKHWEIEENSNVQKMHFTHSDKPVKFYNNRLLYTTIVNNVTSPKSFIIHL